MIYFQTVLNALKTTFNQQPMHRFFHLLFFVATSIITFSSCSSKKVEIPKSTQSGLGDWKAWNQKLRDYTPSIGTYGGQLVVSSFGGDAKTFNPSLSSEVSSSEILQFIFEGLTCQNMLTLDPVPGIAESWTISADQLTYDFVLRNDVFWTDGQPLTPDDVVFTLDVIYDKNNISPIRDILLIDGKEIKATKTGPRSVRMQLPCIFSPFLKVISGIGLPIIPKHLLNDLQKSGTFASAWGINTNVSQIIGTGPFIIDSYEPSQNIILKRNPRYWKKDKAGNSLPYLDKISFIYVKDQSSELMKFQNGETDYLELFSENYPILKPQEKAQNFTIYNLGPYFKEVHLLFNQNPEINPETKKPIVAPYKVKWFRNKRFRQAIAYCFDRGEMINIVQNGLATLQWTPMSEAAGCYYNSHVKQYPYNLDSARAILKQEGFADRNGDGKLEDPDGNIVEFSMVTNAGNSDRKKYSEIIRKDLEKVGITAYVNLLEFNNLVDKLENTYDWETMILGLTGSDEPHMGAMVWMSSSRSHEWYPKQKSPSTPWEARIDTLFTLGVQEMDKTKRKAFYDEWQEIFAEQLPYITLVTPLRLAAVRNKFGNICPAPAAEAAWYYKRMFFHNIEEIYVLPGKK
jgi:peptide/nickel transport system substrate-binding protein